MGIYIATTGGRINTLFGVRLITPQSTRNVLVVFFAACGMFVLSPSGTADTPCEKAKANQLADCLSQATSDVTDCQNHCEADPDDPSAYNECRRVCSNEEQKDRTGCFDADKKIHCP
jgi:hypothetical protein